MALDHEKRATGIGSSEISSVVGLNPWRSPRELWLVKTGRKQVRDTPAMRRGRFLEPAILEWFSHERKCELEFPGTIRHPEHEIALATPDAFATYKNGRHTAVEVKTTGRMSSQDWGRIRVLEIPKYVALQSQWQMGIAGKKEADIVALVVGELKVYRLEFRPKIFSALLLAATEFWMSFIVPDQDPKDWRFDYGRHSPNAADAA